MPARNMILTVLLGGPLAGTLLGVAANPTMVAPPEPAWRSARPDPSDSQPQRIVEMGPQDLSPYWDADRTPTWKRRAMELQAAAYAPPPDTGYVEAPDVLPALPTEPEQASGPKVVTWPATPMAEAAAQQAADRDAQAGPDAAPQPALVDAAEAPTL
jgi:hypothetical protein